MALLGTDDVQIYSIQEVIEMLQELQEDDEERYLVLGKYIHKDGEDFTISAAVGQDDTARVGPFAYPRDLWEDPTDIRTSVNQINTQLIGSTLVSKENLSEKAINIVENREE